ncbi:MAG: hypothetical protein MUO18_04020 [Methanomassiliicoccales archaeon]|nr:hypothetical protein [Methanomassiliicoccales archaeon]
MMFLTLKIVQQPGENGGTIEILKRKTITCRVRLGVVAFADEDEKRYLINILTQNGSAGEIVP